MYRITKSIGLFTLACALNAAVKLPALISDHMVLQQGQPVRVWGSADPNESVKVEFQGQSVAVTAAQNGKWAAWLKPLVAGGPLEMTINGNIIKDVLVGEVWLGSGQSNMEFRLQTAVNHDEEIANANYPMMHLFQVKKAVADQPAEDVVGTWQVCAPASVKGFSAVEYFFGRHLLNNLHVPMGLIESDWGGTPAESWTSREAVQADPALKFVNENWDKVMANYPAAKERYDTVTIPAWEKAVADAKTAGKTPPNRPGGPQGTGHPNTPAGLYNAMIAPLVPYGIRGAIWYQGESNANEANAYRYRRLFGAMIQDWRNRWGQGDFPFLFVQLANFHSNPYWPVLRESQTETLRLANTGMAVIHDVGESKDIHPKNKQDVGLRLALAARAIAYKQGIEYAGPMFQVATPENGAMRVYFAHADGMRSSNHEAITGFEIAGADGKYVAAEAKVDGNTIVVSSPQVASPMTVRYAWADDPVCNLVNQVGLPASSFRSDQPHYQ
ncbi:MAG: Sialate O-acetylesterase [Candidatus Solibacter sp.]|nr:Sialate O-acetylesterase [Candidatus Solibacter sp.]